MCYTNFSKGTSVAQIKHQIFVEYQVNYDDDQVFFSSQVSFISRNKTTFFTFELPCFGDISFNNKTFFYGLFSFS